MSKYTIKNKKVNKNDDYEFGYFFGYDVKPISNNDLNKYYNKYPLKYLLTEKEEIFLINKLI